jgi:hypothetical protein
VRKEKGSEGRRNKKEIKKSKINTHIKKEYKWTDKKSKREKRIKEWERQRKEGRR